MRIIVIVEIDIDDEIKEIGEDKGRKEKINVIKEIMERKMGWERKEEIIVIEVGLRNMDGRWRRRVERREGIEKEKDLREEVKGEMDDIVEIVMDGKENIEEIRKRNEGKGRVERKRKNRIEVEKKKE